jgi:hypothetical protein
MPLHGETGRFGHPGAGGSIAWADAGLGAGFAVLRNRLTPDGWRDASIQRIAGAAIAAADRWRRQPREASP